MKLGVRGHDYGRHSIEQVAEILANEGYQTIQLALLRTFTEINSYKDITETRLEQISETFSSKGISFSVLGCYVDLSAPDSQVRKIAVDTFIDCMSYSKILKANVTGTETSYEHLSQMEKRRRFPFMLESLKRIADAAERLDTDFALEPVNWHPLENAQVMREVLDSLGTNHGKIILDPANILEEPQLYQQKYYWEQVFSLLERDIVAIHLKDFVMKDKNYVSTLLGEGVMEFDRLKEFLKEHPNMPLLREEMMPATAHQDITFMKGL